MPPQSRPVYAVTHSPFDRQCPWSLLLDRCFEGYPITAIPLQLATLVGFAFTLFGIAILAFVVGRYLLRGTTVAGFPFLASIVAISSGAQLFALGILGEYLGRMHMRTMDRPAYIVRTATARSDA